MVRAPLSCGTILRHKMAGRSGRRCWMKWLGSREMTRHESCESGMMAKTCEFCPYSNLVYKRKLLSSVAQLGHGSASPNALSVSAVRRQPRFQHKRLKQPTIKSIRNLNFYKKIPKYPHTGAPKVSLLNGSTEGVR